MALFGRRQKADKPGSAEVHPLVGRAVFCGVCGKEQMFNRCWRRASHVRQCPCCQLVFEDAAALYRRFQAVCPQCGEPLEQPGFDYGLCDGCGWKFEIVEGTKPGLLPNRQQRAEMDKHGKARSPE